MIKAKMFVTLPAVLLGLFLQSAGAYNLGFLNNSPVRYFTDQDWELSTAAIRKALNETKDGDTVSWENPKTKYSGTVTPTQTETRDAVTCRRLQIVNNAKGRTGSSRYRFCQKPDGTWAVEQAGSATSDGTESQPEQSE